MDPPRRPPRRSSSSSTNPLSDSSPVPSTAPSTVPTETDHTLSPSLPPLPPLRNPKYRHVSRSAAKRESVQLLGSIRDLQLRFSTGVTIEHRAGTGLGVKGLPGLGEEDEAGGADWEGEGDENGPLRIVNASSYAYPSSSRQGGHSVRADGGKRERRPYKDVDLPKIGLDQARSESSSLTTGLCAIWSESTSIDGSSDTRAAHSLSSSGVRDAFIATAQGVRRARHLALASHAHVLANARHAAAAHVHAASSIDGSGIRRSSAPATRPRAMLSTPSRPGQLPRAVSYAVPERKTSSAETAGTGVGVAGDARATKEWEEDAYYTLRRAAIDVLTQLRHLEERLRVHAPTPAVVVSHEEICDSPSATDGSTFTAQQSGLSPHVPAVDTVRPASAMSGYSDTDTGVDPDADTGAGYDSEEDEYNLNALAQAVEERVHVPWEERIVAEQREYRSPGQGANGQAEGAGKGETDEVKGVREAVERWADVVRRLFDAATAEKEKGKADAPWVVDDWQGRSMERVLVFLTAQLPLNLQLLLPSQSSSTDSTFSSSLLARLSDGYILIQAHNASLYTSAKPWGFIPDEDVHDTLSSSTSTPGPSEATESAREWTFRRTGNLTCWAAALRFRYNLPIHLPASAQLRLPSLLAPSPGPSPNPNAGVSPNLSLHRSGPPPASAPMQVPGSGSGSGFGRKEGPRIDFDPSLVAKRENGWEGMLEQVLAAWVDAAAGEIAAEAKV